MQHSRTYLITRAIVRVLFWVALVAVAVWVTGGDFR